MNHLLAKSLLRSLSTGGNGIRCVSHSVAPVSGKILKLTSASSLDEMSLMRRFQDSGLLVSLSTRMMTTSTDPTRLDENGVDDGTVSVNKDENVNKQHAVSSYWGISWPAIVREDGFNWPWNCFMHRETYQSNLSIDLNKHHKPTTFLDKVAFRTVNRPRIPTDIFFQRRHGCRATMLETVAAVPGMVGGTLLHQRGVNHLSSVRSFATSTQDNRRFRKQRRGRMNGMSSSGNHISFGKYALQALEPAWITSRQIEAGRRAVIRNVRRGARIWVRVFPDKAVTKRPTETRMGRGKGAPAFMVAVVKPGRILYEMNGVTEDMARQAISVAGSKMPIHTKFIVLK